MPVNPYFSNFPKKVSGEQNLIEDLLLESIKMYGSDNTYIVRESLTGSEQDLIYGEDPTSLFSKHYILEMYLNNTMDNISGGTFAGRFGLQINESVSFLITRRTFQKWIPSSVATRPREGDLIYVPFSTNLYEIKNVNQEKNYYTLGRSGDIPYMYEVTCELFKASQESISTGIPEIDDIELEGSYAINLALDSGSGTGNYHINELVYQGGSYATSVAVAEVKAWSPGAKLLKIVNIKGVFANTGNVRGVTSNTTYNITSYDPKEDHTEFGDSQNAAIEGEIDDLIDSSEINPFGQL